MGSCGIGQVLCTDCTTEGSAFSVTLCCCVGCETITNPDVSLEFRVYLVNAQTGAHTQESRNLKFWFKSSVLLREQSSIAQHMFRDLVSPNEFPRGDEPALSCFTHWCDKSGEMTTILRAFIFPDYVGFIKKIMKLMQKPYVTIKKIEIELKQIEEGGKFPKAPRECPLFLDCRF